MLSWFYTMPMLLSWLARHGQMYLVLVTIMTISCVPYDANGAYLIYLMIPMMLSYQMMPITLCCWSGADHGA